MQIVIDIPEKVYTYIQREWEEYDFDSVLNHLINGIKRGTPLPEHHGRLIDADYLVDNLDKYIQVARYYNKEDNLITHIITKIDDVPTIIKADRRE